MISCNHMCCHSYNGSQEPFFNKIILVLTRQRVFQDNLRTVITLSWLARSPDLSPIEHIWNHFGWRLVPPMNLNELEAMLQQIWNEMSLDIIQNLYASMSDCIASCLRARGGSTAY
ncbi:transposable element Tcb1 transposase [Trichonephila clavipes]|nr:transposable element Tcb1 transposase [Trichonephila clavipes]